MKLTKCNIKEKWKIPNYSIWIGVCITHFTMHYPFFTLSLNLMIDIYSGPHCPLRQLEGSPSASCVWSYNVTFHATAIAVHSKNTRVRNWPGKGPLGPNSIPGQRWPGNQSTWRGMWPRAGSVWPHYYLSSLQKADQFPGHLWPGIEFGPNGPFSGSHWPGCF